MRAAEERGGAARERGASGLEQLRVARAAVVAAGEREASLASEAVGDVVEVDDDGYAYLPRLFVSTWSDGTMRAPSAPLAAVLFIASGASFA